MVASEDVVAQEEVQQFGGVFQGLATNLERITEREKGEVERVRKTVEFASTSIGHDGSQQGQSDHHNDADDDQETVDMEEEQDNELKRTDTAESWAKWLQHLDGRRWMETMNDWEGGF